MKPPGFDSTKRYPVLFYVYGEPAGQTALDSWGGEEYLWHLMLTQQGYVVASVDNRGTPSPGDAAFRKAIYKRSAWSTRPIRRRPRAPSDAGPGWTRPAIGIWGWSGGGSSTLNAMFRYPDVYATGMAVAPVPDVQLYDTIYQERYMGLPQENEDGLPRRLAAQLRRRLRGNLLVVHGSGDDNVHYQGTERLVNALVAANRPFTLMVYPNRSHCICEGEGTEAASLLAAHALPRAEPAGGRRADRL